MDWASWSATITTWHITMYLGTIFLLVSSRPLPWQLSPHINSNASGFHLHLVLDYFGSGPGWGIHYFWPFSNYEILNPYAWNFLSWQNLCAAAFFLLWTIAIIVKSKRTPLEVIMPSLDQKIVQAFNRVG